MFRNFTEPWLRSAKGDLGQVRAVFGQNWGRFTRDDLGKFEVMSAKS